MLKQLRVKFVLITMILVCSMLVLIMAMVVHFTKENLEYQSIQMMQTIAAEPFQPGRPNNNNDIGPYLPFFTLEIVPGGELFATGSGHFDLSDESLLRELADAAMESEEQVGVLEEYNLRYMRTTRFNVDTVVFVDMSNELATVSSLINTCAVIGVVSFLAFLFICVRLAKWATRPVEEAWNNQKQFIADASHELKTPLTVIMTNAELLRGPDCDDQAREQFSSSILTMTSQMRGLVEGLLELARVDTGAVRTAFAPVDMSGLVSEECMLFEPLFFENGLFLECDAEPGLTVRGSARHLGQVLKIMLDNAMKYSAAGTVRVRLRHSANLCLLSVSNPGPEIPEEDRKNLFKRFYRADKSRHRDGSYGLGLSIAMSIVVDHGGKIWVESNGTENSFHVQIPHI